MRAPSFIQHPCSKVVCVIIVSLFLRLLYSSFVDVSGIGDIDGVGDQVFYLEGAKAIFESASYSYDGSPTYFRAPLYSYFISPIYSPSSLVWGRNIFLLQSFLTYASSLFFSFVISRVYSFRVSLVWLALWLCTPFSFIQDKLVLQESLYTSLLISVIALCLLFGGRISRILVLYILPVVLGLLLGLIALTREVYALFPFLLFPALAFHLLLRPLLKVRVLLISALVMILAIAPWLHRNYLLSPGAPFISKGIMGLSLYYGTWVEGGASHWSQKWLKGVDLPTAAFNLSSFDKQYVQDAVVSRNDSDLKRIAIDSIINHPLKVVSNWLRRAPSMWLGTRSELIDLKVEAGSTDWYMIKISMYLLNLSILTLGLLFAFFSLSSITSSFLVLASLPVYNALIYLPFLNIEPRYSHPSLPVVILFAVLSVSSGLKRFNFFRI